MKHRAFAASTRRHRHASRMRHRRWSQVVAVTTAAALGFGVVYVHTTVNLVTSAFNVSDIDQLLGDDWVDPYAEFQDPSSGADINILLLASDIRDGENADLGGSVDGMRADATVILHISADRTRVDALSIPRDLRVRIADCELNDGTIVRGWTDKFNVAFANGGRYGNVSEAAACAVRTVREITGISIDHYAVFDFVGFRDMIDAIDGVPMCVPQRMYSSKANLDLQPGPQMLDGTTALAWARARTGTGLGDGSDPTRIGRQQELMGNIARKVLTMNLATDVGQLTQFTRATASSIYLDSQLADINYLVGLGLSLSDFDMDDLTFATVPWGSPGDGSGDIIMTAEAEQIFRAIALDQPLPTFEEEVEEPGPTPAPAPGSSDTDEEPVERRKRFIDYPDASELPPPPSLSDLSRAADLAILGECTY